jgi:glyoxylase-like metal-dependent hydrolase (beta-lactamase superfamily II)
MKHLLGISAALLATTALVQVASAKDSPADLVKGAIAAEGGADALKAISSLAIKADAKHWEPGQSLKAGGEPRFLGDSKVTITWDVAKGQARMEMDRDMVYPPPASKAKYTEVITPNYGFVIAANGTPSAASGMRLASQQREFARVSPALLLKASETSANLASAGNQKLGKASLPAVTYTDGGTKFTILFDPKTHLPAAIRTLDDDNIAGDANYDVVLGDWRAVGGAKVAYSYTYNVNDVKVAQYTVTDVTPNASIAADAFTAPDAIKANLKTPMTGNVPYQWVLRRIALARFLDADTIFYPPAAPPRQVDLAPNVTQVVTGANNLIINGKDGLTIVEAPVGEVQSKAIIDIARQKYPGKPIKTLILTHHHMDHTGGMRTYAAEGANVIVPTPDKAYFEKDLKGTHTVLADELSKNPKKAGKVTEVKDQMTIKDDNVEVKLYRIDNPHVDGILIVHLPKENIVWVTDLWNPGTNAGKSENAEAFAAALKKLGIAGATIAGGHGNNGKQSDLEAVVASK